MSQRVLKTNRNNRRFIFLFEITVLPILISVVWSKIEFTLHIVNCYCLKGLIENNI